MRERGHTQCHCRRVICKCQSLACQGKSERERVEGGRRKEGESPMEEGGIEGKNMSVLAGWRRQESSGVGGRVKNKAGVEEM